MLFLSQANGRNVRVPMLNKKTPVKIKNLYCISGQWNTVRYSVSVYFEFLVLYFCTSGRPAPRYGAVSGGNPPLATRNCQSWPWGGEMADSNSRPLRHTLFISILFLLQIIYSERHHYQILNQLYWRDSLTRLVTLIFSANTFPLNRCNTPKSVFTISSNSQRYSSSKLTQRCQ